MALSVQRVSSVGDERLELFRAVRDKDLRGRGRLFMAESDLVVLRLLRQPERVHSMFLSQRAHARLADRLAVLEPLERDVPVYVADLDVMTQIAGFHIHRGVLAAGMRPRASALTLDAALGGLKRRQRVVLLLAEGVTNVDNLGALFRNAAGFGADGIVLDPTCCDPLYRKAVRVSMGHVLAVPWAVSRNWGTDLRRLKQEWGLRLVGAEVRQSSRPVWEMQDADRVAMVFGEERHGLRQESLAACDEVCQIPMAGGVESVNVAVASAVFLYETQKRQMR